MDILDEDLLGLWEKLSKNEVQYIMVGGFAAIMHGISRITQDVDIWIKDTPDNRIRLRKTIKELGLGDFESIEKMEFVPGWTSIYLGLGLELDIMTYLKLFPQTSFDDCFQKSYKAIINGISIPFLHINQLMEEKEANARPKDLLDLEELRKIVSEEKK
ncbi:MAG: hypothetical protein MH472_05795 [Bacteroidia bacterium]|nr:hypothetical protein [Bacteroidia bacterium]